MSLAAQQSLESHYVMHTFGRSPVEFVEGHGMKLTGDDGREYLDFLAGIGVCSLGHGDPAVLSALEAQTKKLMGPRLRMSRFGRPSLPTLAPRPTRAR